MFNRAVNISRPVTASVLYVLKYYSAFRYPLKADEIHRYCPEKCALPAVREGLEELVNCGEVYASGGYYSLLPEIDPLIARREKGNSFAKQRIPKAYRAANIIYSFPFVKFVGISGSLSKGYADEKSDFDFFIITAPNRLWICRTLLHLFKKATFLLGQQHKFCMNYFIDAGRPDIEEQNQFTAIELATLIPVKGFAEYRRLHRANEWAKDYLPNCRMGEEIGPQYEGDYPFKKLGEALFNIFSPAQLNKKLMQLTDKKWRNKWRRKNYPLQDYELAFKTGLYVSKNHPANHQKRVLQHIQRLAQ